MRDGTILIKCRKLLLDELFTVMEINGIDDKAVP